MGKHNRPNRIIVALTKAARKGNTDAATELRVAVRNNTRAATEAQAALDTLKDNE